MYGKPEESSANFVLNRANFYFMNLLQTVQQTVTRLKSFRVQKASLNMLWEYSPSLANPASDWLRPPVDEEEIKIKMDDSVDISLASKGTDLFADLWKAQPGLWDPE